MKNIAKLILSVACIFIIQSKVAAQFYDTKNTSTEERAQKQTEWMQKELALDSSIITEVYDINLKYTRQIESVQQSDMARFKKFRELKSLSKDKDKELKVILSNSQFEKYQAKKEEMREKMKQQKQNNQS